MGSFEIRSPGTRSNEQILEERDRDPQRLGILGAARQFIDNHTLVFYTTYMLALVVFMKHKEVNRWFLLLMLVSYLISLLMDYLICE